MKKTDFADRAYIRSACGNRQNKVSTTIDDETYRQVVRLIYESGRSLSAILREAIRKGVDKINVR